ncbi:MAG: hypothetical protein V4714_06785 [Bacteroidota bacterium]
MTSLLWRKFTAYSISAALVIYPNIASNGCSDFDDTESTYILFAPEIIQQLSFEPFFYAPYTHYYGDQEAVNTSESIDNLSEWAEYFKTKASFKDLDSLIYSTDLKEVQELIKVNTSRKPLPASHPLAKNTAVQAVFQANDQEFLNYLLFAKKCEPFVSVDAWEEEKQVQPAMGKLMLEGKKLYALALSPVIKLRYAFQVVRLAHYNQDYKGCIQLYNELVNPLPQESLIKYWAMAHKAGALKATEAYPEAVYLYSRVFDKCPSRQLAAFGSIQFSREEWLAKSLNQCKSQEEKSTLLFMASLEHTDYDLPSLQKIYQATPNDPRLLVLLGREINKLESAHSEWTGGITAEKAPTNNPAKALKDFVVQVADLKTIPQPDLWYFAAGYLSYLDKDWANVKSYFKKAKKANSKDEVLQGQIHIIEIMLKVAEAKKLDVKFENDILSEIQWLKTAKTVNLRFSNAYTFLMGVLGKKYKEQGNKLMSYLCLSHADSYAYSSYSYSQYMFYRPDAPFTRELIVWMEKTSKTDFEKFLYKDFKPSKNELIELEGSLLLAKYQFKEAIAKYNQIDSTDKGSETYTLPADPFAIHINDCHDCDFEAPKKKTYTKRSFAEEMLNFEDLIVKDAKNAGQYYFFLANGYYNLSYYGNTWMAIDYSSRSRDPKDQTYTDNSKALEYYLKALSLTKNKEFAAKCVFMASKCEQNAYYNSPAYEEERKNQPRAYFKTLKDNYSSTKYYQQVIGECERFAKYVK